MECKRTSTRQKGFTLPEIVITLALLVVLVGTLGSLYVHSTRTFVESANYMDFENQSRAALNRMSRTIRQANSLTYYDSNKLTFLVGTNFVSFTYYPGQRTLRQETALTSKALLSDCDYVNYGIYQRNLSNSYDYYPAATLASCKVVQLDWGCSRMVLGRSNTAAAVSAKVVIRKQ
jgi:prepilin-type N-terminal cleavage/methylation domain-containing protein